MIREAKADGLAIITGAAGGFGSCFARRLAEQGHNLLLVDRRCEPLAQLSDAIADHYGVHVNCRACDLTNATDLHQLAEQLSELNDVRYLINNAGFAHLKNFVEISASDHARMSALHVHAPMVLIRAVLPGMIERRGGCVINVSSLGAWLPSGDAQYAATKAYQLVLAQALHEEVSQYGVRVQALCPSFVDTGFHNTDEMQRFPRAAIPQGMWMKAEDVIDCSLRSLRQDRVVVIPGWRNRIVSLALRSPFLQPIVNRLVKPKEAANMVRS